MSLGICTPRRNRLREELDRRTKSMADDIAFFQREHAQALKNALHYAGLYKQERDVNRLLRLSLADARRDVERLTAERALSVRVDEVPTNHLRRVS